MTKQFTVLHSVQQAQLKNVSVCFKVFYVIGFLKWNIFACSKGTNADVGAIQSKLILVFVSDISFQPLSFALP